MANSEVFKILFDIIFNYVWVKFIFNSLNKDIEEMLSGELIKQKVENDELIIENFDPTKLSPASYDAKLGKTGYTTESRARIDIENAGHVIIKAGDFAIVTSFETFEIPMDIAGHIGLRSYYTRKGMIQLSGPQLDPGFKGIIIIGLFNASPRDIMIPYKEALISLEFIKLIEPAKVGYTGKYQDQYSIPAPDLEWLIESKGVTFSQVALELSSLSKNVNDLTTNVNALQESVSTFKWVIGTGFTFLGLLIAVISIFS